MKIGFVLLSAAVTPIPSTRVAVLNMIPHLRDAGFEPHVVFEPPIATQTPAVDISADALVADGYKIVCFQKVSGPEVLALATALRARGVKTVFLVCDVIDEAMARATDATIVVTDFLRSLYPAEVQNKIHVVHDGIERPEIHKTRWRSDRGSAGQPLRAVLVTSARLEVLPVLVAPPPWLEITIAGRYPTYAGATERLRDAQWHLRQHPGWARRLAALRFLLQPRVRCVPWHPDDVYQQLLSADIGIIPIDVSQTPAGTTPPNWMVKSENRLTLKMSAGLPVIATPIPAYEPAVTQGVSGFLARTRGEWLACLEALRDPLLRRSVGDAAREAVSVRYSMATQAERLVSVFRLLLDGTPQFD